MTPTLEALAHPVTGRLFDAHLAITTLLSGQTGDADPRHLIQGAADALRDALEALETENPA